MQRIALLLLFFLAAATASAQNLSVFNLDVTNFPTLKASFYAFDVNGQVQHPVAQDVTVTENGIPRTVVSLTCPGATTAKALSSVLVMDVSGSMADGSGPDPNITLAQEAAKAWIEGLPLGSSECAITSFDSYNYFLQDFTKDKTKLLSAISSLAPSGGTDYDEALLNAPAGGLQVTSKAKYQKIIIMLTDGMPNKEPQTAAIASKAQQENCIIYAVTLGMPCPQNLKTISTQTGGNWFENVTTVDEAKNVYAQILQNAQGFLPCTLTWTSGTSCTAGSTKVDVAWNGVYSFLTYTPPTAAIAKMNVIPAYLFCSSKQPGVKFDTTVTLTAVNSAFTVTDITSTNPAFDINPKSFTIAAGSSQTVTISFTPPDSGYTWATFTVISDICPQTFFASGGFPGHKPSAPTIKLLTPNGGEKFLGGSDTVITWTGVALTDTVRLEYSLDNGSTWKVITTTATGGSYPWHVPKTASSECLARVSQQAKGGAGGWADHPTGQTFYNGLCAADQFDNVYLTAEFGGDLKFGSITLKDNNGREAVFITKYHSDGSVEWAKKINASAPATCISTDPIGNIYLAGNFDESMDFGNGTVLNATDTFPGWTAYLAKYHPDGNLEWAVKAGGLGTTTGDGVAGDASGSVYLWGTFNDSADFGGTPLISPGRTLYLAKYHSDGTLDWVKAIPNSYPNASGIALDPSGNIYVSGQFQRTMILGSTTLRSLSEDCFLAKYHSDGTVEWAKKYGGGGVYQWYNNIAVDASGNAFVVGSFIDSIFFESDTFASNKGAFNDDTYLAKYKTDGTFQWAQILRGASAHYVDAVAVDALGSAYIAGNFKDTLNAGSQLISEGNSDIFAIKYKPDGSIDWGKRAGGTGTDNGEGFAVTPSGVTYVSGYYNAPSADFDGTTLQTQWDDQTFIWRIGGDATMQSDVSDAVFSIVLPQPASQDIDMGKVLVSATKDSVVIGFIRNAGSFPLYIDSIAITGPDASQFSLVSGIPPYNIPAGSSHQVEFRFRPSSIGLKAAVLNVMTQADTLTQFMTGEGVASQLQVIGSVIDFGQVPIGSAKDTTITIAIKNISSSPVSFSGTINLGPNKTDFSMTSGAAPFTLNPGAAQTVSLRFTPPALGRTSGSIGFNFGGAGSPAVLNLIGEGIGGLVYIPDDSGYPGDHRKILLLIGAASGISQQSAVSSFQAQIVYDKTILYPESNNVKHGRQFDTLSVTNSVGTSDTLAILPFIAMLGDNMKTPMSIASFQWLDASGQPANFQSQTQDGTFYLLGICPAGGNRLYNPNGQVTMAHNPNPSNGIIHIDIQTTELGRTQVAVMNLLGQRIATISDGELKPGAHAFDFNASNLSAGSYFLLLETPTVRRLERIDVEK